jgi:uncharacterized protein with LGFP repeats
VLVVAMAAALAVALPSGAEAADPTAFDPGPPACLTTPWIRVNAQKAQTEVQLPSSELRFGDHIYRVQRRFTQPISNAVPRGWMNACANLPTQQVIVVDKLFTLGLLNGEVATFATTTVAHLTGRPWAEVRGAINDKYKELGGWISFGIPLTSETPTPHRVGAFNHFSKRNSIYWSPTTGAHEVRSRVRDKWASLGWENSFLGFPLTDERYGVGNNRYNDFEGGTIMWTQATGAHEVHGAIRDLWTTLGRDRRLLGAPRTDETPTPNKPGRFNHFQGGSIYWSAATGAHEVHGAIRDTWASLGWENSFLGFPTTNETPTPNKPGRFNHFQGGSIYWSATTGAHEVHGAIRDKWASLGWENSELGFPKSDEYAIPGGGRRSDFESNCHIDWYPATGATAYCNHVPNF